MRKFEEIIKEVEKIKIIYNADFKKKFLTDEDVQWNCTSTTLNAINLYLKDSKLIEFIK